MGEKSLGCQRQGSQATPWSQRALNYDDLSKKNPTASNQTNNTAEWQILTFYQLGIFSEFSQPHLFHWLVNIHRGRHSWPLGVSTAGAKR